MVSLCTRHLLKIFVLTALAATWTYTLHMHLVPMVGLSQDNYTLFYGFVVELLSAAGLTVLLIDTSCNPPKALADEWEESSKQNRANELASRELYQRERDRDALRRAVISGKAAPEALGREDE